MHFFSYNTNFIATLRLKFLPKKEIRKRNTCRNFAQNEFDKNDFI